MSPVLNIFAKFHPSSCWSFARKTVFIHSSKLRIHGQAPTSALGPRPGVALRAAFSHIISPIFRHQSLQLSFRDRGESISAGAGPRPRCAIRVRDRYFVLAKPRARIFPRARARACARVRARACARVCARVRACLRVRARACARVCACPRACVCTRAHAAAFPSLSRSEVRRQATILRPFRGPNPTFRKTPISPEIL